MAHEEFGSAKYLAAFVNEYIFEFPTTIFINIVEYLPFNFIFDYLLRLTNREDIKSVILEWYFNHTEVTFQINSSVIDSTAINNVSNISKIVHMTQLVQLPAFNPKQLTIVCRGLQFTEVRPLMEKLKVRLATYSNLTVVVEDIRKFDNSLLPDYAFLKDDLRFLLSFSNLKSLSLEYLEARTPKKKAVLSIGDLLTIDEFSNNDNLEDFVSTNSGLQTWSSVSFPHQLTSLTINSVQIDASSIRIPDSVLRLNLSKCNISDEILEDMTLPKGLIVLDLSFNEMTVLPFAKLPFTIEEVQFGSNYVIKDIIMPENGRWLPNLKFLNLTQCGIHDALLVKLCSYFWPSGLQHLKLTWNLLEDITPLKTLPDSLRILDIASHNPLIVKDAEHFKFPEALELLVINLQPFTGKLTLPPGMKDLRLPSRGANIESFEIPSLLHKLYTLSIHIGNLNKISWNEFVNLEELSLTNCGIETIEDWIPPPSLKLLALTANPIKEITRNAPVFDKRFHKLKSISFFSCQISYFDEDIELPFYLTSLDLSFNKIKTWEFPQDRFKRVRFNLEGNPFTEIRIPTGNGTGLFGRR